LTVGIKKQQKGEEIMVEFNKLSIGKLRPAKEQTKPRSPNMLGTITLQRATLEALLKQMDHADDDAKNAMVSHIHLILQDKYFRVKSYNGRVICQIEKQN
jgi:hypothetical protein